MSKTLTSGPLAGLSGTLRPPSDKSLTHRAYLFAALAEEPCTVFHPLLSEDCEATRRCLGQLGVGSDVTQAGQTLVFPQHPWQTPQEPLDCGNSGTTMRLLSGLVASLPGLEATLVGDPSLSRRPMKRVAEPLRAMGAEVEGDHAPLHIRGARLHGIHHHSPVASAQIKSAVLLAGLRAKGQTWVTEPSPSRDHTERMLQALGAEVLREGTAVGVRGGASWGGFQFSVPADISSAAFWLVAAALLPGSEVTLTEVGVNPTRTGILDVFAQAGIAVVHTNAHLTAGEPIADLTVRGGAPMRAFRIEGALVPRLIDEVPVLAVLATQCDGVTEIRDAAELQVKESDRIATVAEGLSAMGAHIEALPDGLRITGPTPLRGVELDAQGDHRLAMAFAVAGMITQSGAVTVHGAETVATSYPDFETHLQRLAVV